MDAYAGFSNASIAKLLRHIAAAILLKSDGMPPKDRFRMVAYQKAADAIEGLPYELYDHWKKRNAFDIPGIGSIIGTGLKDYFQSGTSAHFDDLLSGIPESVFALIDVPGIGPKKAFRLVTECALLNADTVFIDLLKAGRSGRIAPLEGFGEKSQEDIIRAVETHMYGDRRAERMPLPYAERIADKMATYLADKKTIQRIDVLGSLRRKAATIGDIDIAVMSEKTEAPDIISHFLRYPGIRSIEVQGDLKASILIENNIRVDLRVQEKETYGTMLQYFTGSKAHNIQLREFALKKGFSLSEYGLKRLADGSVLTFEDEETLYKQLGLRYIPPEERRGDGEIEKAIL